VAYRLFGDSVGAVTSPGNFAPLAVASKGQSRISHPTHRKAPALHRGLQF
jgi:hypothetical protein